MIEMMSAVPVGVVGVKFSGHVTRTEYRERLRPRLDELVEAGDPIRMLVVLDAEFDKFEPGALWEDIKFGAHDGLSHASKFVRTALVSDAEWAHHAITLFGWMVPGDVKVFDLDSLSDAIEWVAAV